MKVKDLMGILSKVDQEDVVIIRYLDVDGYHYFCSAKCAIEFCIDLYGDDS